MHVPDLRYVGYRFPYDVIGHAVWLYHRFCLSFRDAEDLLVNLSRRFSGVILGLSGRHAYLAWTDGCLSGETSQPQDVGIAQVEVGVDPNQDDRRADGENARRDESPLSRLERERCVGESQG